MDAPGGFAVPSVDRYKEALIAIESVMTRVQRTMLAFHYRAPDRAATFLQLGLVAGYDDYRLAHVDYVKLAERLGNEIGLTFDMHTSSDGQQSPLFSSAIGSGRHFPDEETGHFQLVMHDELATALDQLGWFRD
jgi:hypothetical protein